MGEFKLDDAAAYATLMTPYQGEHVWRWAQLFCSPGCHRDAAFTQRTFTSSADYDNKPQFDLLSRFYKAAAGRVTVCRQCPPGTAVSHYQGASMVGVASAPFMTTCRPWFGALPSFDADGLQAFTKAQYPPSDMVQFPLEEITYTVGSLCPPNTYNRICAEMRTFTYSITGENACTACEEGWHTAGASGAWFCLPPAGLLFSTKTRMVRAPFWHALMLL